MKERKGKNQKWRSTRKDYRMYHFTGRETAKYLLEGAAVCAAADYLFYQSLPVLLFMFPIPVLFLKMQRKKCTVRQQRELNYQFRDALTAMNVAVQAGYSAENAVRASVKDLGRLYEKGSDILDEFRYIESQLRLSVPVEELFLDLGKRSGVEDIENFAAVFYTAKRTGGDMTQVIQKVARMLSDKIEVNCTDNDFAGRWACAHIKKMYSDRYQIIENLPEKEGADYGDLAKEAFGIAQEKKKDKAR